MFFYVYLDNIVYKIVIYSTEKNCVFGLLLNNRSFTTAMKTELYV